jgi:hypothetical protein
MTTTSRRKFRVTATVEEFVPGAESGREPIPPVDQWTGQWLEDEIDSWRFEHMQIESVEEITHD